MAKCNVVLRKNGESGKCPNEAVKGGQCSVHERKTSSPARSKALEKKKHMELVRMFRHGEVSGEEVRKNAQRIGYHAKLKHPEIPL